MGAVLVIGAAEALLHGLVDYAGLFPPASLPMADAVERYARFRHGADAWMLGQFVVPVSRLGELDRAAARLEPAARRGGPWRLSALAGDAAVRDAAAVADYNRAAVARDSVGLVDTVELKVGRADDVRQLREAFGAIEAVWCEVAVGPALGAVLDAVREAGAGAKLRTGGVLAEAFPSSEEVARFLLCCARADVPFKATAGLHHAMRGRYRLTYADDSPSALMHGFLNVFLAAALAHQVVRHRHPEPEATATVAALLDEQDAAAFVWRPDHVRWRAQRFDLEELGALRTRARSFGSCSFEEPVSEARAAVSASGGG